ncbi:TapB family protein [Pedobacter nutrimenti]|uniref:DUF3108 domain-containing protein n=1 Tax=Pedobacter nutrimenti TaxID=1241337 RepID=A0A318U737_9SPHI|nr:hypothetical protein [Pedobacter nutrimenti]PYF69462.1 hypothetical protein B0O44_110102 [Pedobacter nutrimenti]
MKKNNLILSALLFLCNTNIFAQDCNNFFFFTENKEVVINNYDKTGKFSGKDIGTISHVQQSGESITSQYRVVKYDAGGKIKQDGNATITCKNGNVSMGFQIPALDEGDKPKEAYFTYPSGMQTGQNLQAGMEMNIKGKVKGKKMDVSFKVENRKVIGKERVNTPAGSYDTFKITYDMDVRFKVLGIGIPMKLKVYEWYSPLAGVVKTESYNKDGQMEEHSILASIK